MRYEEFGFNKQDFWARYSRCLPVRAGIFSPKHTKLLKGRLFFSFFILFLYIIYIHLFLYFNLF
jgi:hypothetical protein